MMDDGKSEIRSSSESDSDDEPLAKMVKRSSTKQLNISSQPTTAEAKPLTAFAHFFNDTQQSIRKKDSAVTFDEVSRIVMSMWDSLDANSKLVYHKREEEDRAKLEQVLHDIVPPLIQQTSSQNEDTIVLPDSNDKSGEDNSQQMEQTKTSDTNSLVSPANFVVQSKPQKVITLSATDKVVITTRGAPDPTTKGPTVYTITNVSLLPKTSSTDSPESSSTKADIQRDQKPVEQPDPIISPPSTSPQSPESPETQAAVKPTVKKVRATRKSKPEGLIGLDQRVTTPSPTQKPCKNSPCERSAVKHKKWEEDFCSSKCVVEYCRNQFQSWVASRKG